MKQIYRISILVAISLIILGSYCIAGDSEKEKLALLAAQKWIMIVDEGKYTESWTEAAEYFKNTVKQDQWEQALEAARKPLGKLISRKVSSTTYITSLPGDPYGQYVIVQFETSFENKKSSIETVTPMMDKDKKWRVSGYYIK
ncbi:MAG: DUF4019 domain-containing protein [Desulfobacterales bacterium]|nr:DUF4019 domain-containing protein [Desulfobacterales bacterium]MBF0397562.1 DUF4019 domain-containing protein [Desulfobacterales bacterium]